MRVKLLAAAAGLALLGFWGTPAASAHPPGGGRYFGNGPHDLAPHWHKTYTPYGPMLWYGNGPHDLMPHRHRVSPYGGLKSYSVTPFGPTTSYHGYPGFRSPYYYSPRVYGGRGFGLYGW